MRANLAMLAVLAGVGLSISGQAIADAKNLSCITGDSPVERRVLRDCERVEPEKPVVTSELPMKVIPPVPPPPPAPIQHEGGRKAGDGPDHHAEPKSSGGNSGGGTAGGPAN
ncbi:MAG TPA: hypothetical protein VGQ35_20505 [Dongiaceae bacterium]|jgi:hypothetical protein|nr:hypothetical protein [Dongiaceae bacterium]